MSLVWENNPGLGEAQRLMSNIFLRGHEPEFYAWGEAATRMWAGLARRSPLPYTGLAVLFSRASKPAPAELRRIGWGGWDIGPEASADRCCGAADLGLDLW